jgi:hypothetical protein
VRRKAEAGSFLKPPISENEKGTKHDTTKEGRIKNAGLIKIRREKFNSRGRK